MKSYQELIAWQKSMELVGMVYQLTHNLPKEEQFGLTSQLRRAPSSFTGDQFKKASGSPEK